MTMTRSWKKIRELIEIDAKHIKKGKRLSEFTDTKILSHAAEEIVELMAEPDDLEELADIIACLIHYSIKHGWGPNMIDKAIIKKLNERFE